MMTTNEAEWRVGTRLFQDELEAMDHALDVAETMRGIDVAVERRVCGKWVVYVSARLDYLVGVPWN